MVSHRIPAIKKFDFAKVATLDKAGLGRRQGSSILNLVEISMSTFDSYALHEIGTI